MASTVLPNGIIIPEKYSRDWYADLYHNWQELDNLLSASTPGDGTLTIQKNDATVGTFSANQATDETINLSVPTKTSDLTNDSGFITEDTSKIPLTGTNALAGSIVPETDNTYDLGSSSYGLRYIYSSTIRSANYESEDGVAGLLLVGGSTPLFRPFFSNNGQIKLGIAEARWKEIWCTQSSINSSSDKRLKQQIDSIDDKLLDAWENVEPAQYKFNDAVETKGKSARYHLGYVSQDIQSALEKSGVNASEYGFFLYDSWEEQEEVSHEETYTEEVETKSGEKQTVTKTRKVIDRPYKAKGDSYGLRYTECLVVECKYLRRCIKRLTARIEELEKGKEQEATK